LSVVLQL